MDDYAKKQAVESEAQRLAAKAAAEQKSFPLNMDAALYRTADNMGLGEVKTDEMRFTVEEDIFITQGFVEGILYVKDGEWTNIHKIAWPPAPAPAATTSGTSMGTGASSSMESSSSSAPSSSAPAAGTPVGMSASGSASSGSMESGATGASASGQPAATPPPAEHHGGGLGDILGGVVSKVEDAIGHRHTESGSKSD